MGYNESMIEIRQTIEFSRWFDGLRDTMAKARIAIRIRRLSLGNPGDVKPVGEGVSELRIDHGPGYRVYFVQRGSVLVMLLCGGDKRSQERDIARAKAMAEELED
jgi:putative addiction module killer protein